MSAAVGCGMFPDFNECVKSMITIINSYKPIQKNVSAYKRYYRDLYLNLYDGIQKQMQVLAEINEEMDENDL